MGFRPTRLAFFYHKWMNKERKNMNTTEIVATSILLLLGAFAWSLQYIMDPSTPDLMFILAMGVFGAALWRALDLAFYLPFLGETAVPSSLLQQMRIEPAQTNFSVALRVAPRASVIYWAAEEKGGYKGYQNAGIVQADPQGNVVLKCRKPGMYRVPFQGLLSPHIHYRVSKTNGLLGPVKTIML